MLQTKVFSEFIQAQVSHDHPVKPAVIVVLTTFVFRFYFYYEPGKTGGRKVRSQRKQNWYTPKLIN